jgi:plasmid stabilization system protein ParE
LADLDAACDYIARDSKRYACLFAERVIAKISTLAAQPFLGAIVPEYGLDDIRERHFQNYRIVYRVRGEGEAVEIAAIVHAARLLPPLPPR